MTEFLLTEVIADSVHLNYSDLTEEDFDDGTIPPNTSCICLKRNLLKSLPSSICRLRNLVQLFVASNYIKHLPEEIGALDRLQVLDVSDNCLTELPARLGEVQSLKKLQISCNYFSLFPTVICKLLNLTVLEASRNDFTSIPSDISCCTKLIQLALDKNCLKSVPRHLFRLKDLQDLSLCGNQLRFLPHGVWRSNKLAWLNLDNNPLMGLPLSLQKLTACIVGLNSCFPLQRLENIEEAIQLEIQSILPDDVTEICIVKQSSVPSLQELAARRIALTGSAEGFRQALPLPAVWLERLIEPLGTCDYCSVEIFTSVFPLIMNRESDGILYYGLFCSVSCVLNHCDELTMKVVYPVRINI